MVFESVTGEGYANYYLSRWFDGYRVGVIRIAKRGPDGIKLCDDLFTHVWPKIVLYRMRRMSLSESTEMRCQFWNQFGIA